MSISLEVLLEQLPEIMLYTVPGLVFMGALNIFSLDSLSTSDVKESVKIIKIIVISFIFQLLSMFLSTFLSVFDLEKSEYGVILNFSLAAVSGILIGMLKNAKGIDKLYVKLTNYTMYNNPWQALADYKRGCYVRIIMRDEDTWFFGTYNRYYIRENQEWLVITNHNVEGTEANRYTPLHADQKQKAADYALVLNLSDVKYVEFYYAQESEVLYPQAKPCRKGSKKQK